MFLRLRRFGTAVLLLTFGLQVAPIQSVFAEEHVISPAQLHQALVDSANTRQDNVEKIQKFFASDTVKKTLSHNMLKSGKIEKAIPFLSDEELSRLALQVQQVEKDIAAGELSNQQITYILIALATAVIILVLVAA